MARLLIIIPLTFLYTNIYSQSFMQVINFENDTRRTQKKSIYFYNRFPYISIPLIIFRTKGNKLMLSLPNHSSENYPNSHINWMNSICFLHIEGITYSTINWYNVNLSKKKFMHISNEGYDYS